MVHSVKDRGRIFKFRDAWCATGPGFQNIVASASGCGPTPEAAYASWATDAKKRPEWLVRRLPSFDDFELD